MILSPSQKEIMQRWFNAYTRMYNETLKLIKKKYQEEHKLYLNARQLRDNFLKNKRNEIIQNSHIDVGKRIKCHNLDYAIQLACANYKSAVSNFKNGNIRNFRIRYWKFNKKRKIMDMEYQYFKGNGMCFSAFGKINYYYNKKVFDIQKIKKTCKIGFEDEKYYLYVPEEITCEKVNNKNKLFSGDPGINTFLTGISENEAIKIGENFYEKIKKELNKIDNLKERNLPTKIIKRYDKISSKRITGMVNELHWKTINYLVKNYNIILIGDMSVKGITNKDSSKLQKITKRIGYRLKFYQFREKLEYKCKSKNIHYVKVDESYTSKICSKCGNLKENLGGSRIYKCEACHLKIDRDINGARGICLKWIKN